jgi:AraC-like DNA-binding protein
MGPMPDASETEPLLRELTALMEHLERDGSFEESLGPDHARLASFCSRRRERLQVKEPAFPIVALVLDGEKRLAGGRRVRRGEVLLLPAHRSVQVVNVPASARRPYRSFVVHVAPQVAAMLAIRYAELASRPAPWAEARVLRPTRSTLLAALHLARTLAEPDAHVELLRHRAEDLLLSVLLASRGELDHAPRSQAGHDPAGALRLLVRRAPHQAWRAADAAAALAMSEPTLRRRLAAAGTTFRAILVDERLRLARTLLEDRTLSVTEVALRCGYQSPSKFAAQLKRAVGSTPSRFAVSAET